MNRVEEIRCLLAAVLLALACATNGAEVRRPNILVAMADDWGYPHAGAYGETVVRTPTFDRLAREGILFRNAFVSSPSCTPSRSALLTGQYHWRLEEAANLWSTLRASIRTYPEILQDAGYVIGHSRKAWGPGRIEAGGRRQDPSGPRFPNLAAFLRDRPKDRPFCFWFGSPDPHRPYEPGTGVGRGMDPDRIRVPACLPDHPTVRSDLADYYFEIERFDREVGAALELLREAGALEDTVVVMTGDNGMPFPRAKSNLYDPGVHVPLALRWPGRAVPGVVIDDFISLTDLAPTFLAAAGLAVPPEMTGRSLVPMLESGRRGWIEPQRDSVLVGKERHVPSQERGVQAGYPGRAIRTRDFLYIRNFRPELWPNGIADGRRSEKGNAFADCDDGPTKSFLVAHQGHPEFGRFFDLAFARRPAEELYDLRVDPGQLRNVAADPAYARERETLERRLMEGLRATSDPRVVGGAERFEAYPYYGQTLRPAAATDGERRAAGATPRPGE